MTETSGRQYSGITHATQKQWYKGKIKIEKSKTKRRNVIFSSAMSYEKAFRKEHSMEYKTASNIRDMEWGKVPRKTKVKKHFPRRG